MLAPNRIARGFRPADAVLRAAVLAGVWWVLNWPDARSWVVGVPVVLTATFLSGALAPSVAWRWRWMGALSFARFFLWHSLLGGIDIARRALDPRMPLRPGFVTVDLRLPPGASRIWLANALSLLPGTLAARLEHDQLIVHAVDTTGAVEAGVRAVEARVAAMFGVAIGSATGGGS